MFCVKVVLYSTMNINICRICLERGSKLMPIFDPIKPPHFSVLIMACASVQVTEGDGLPHFICQKCISKLNIAYQFKIQCESSDTKLRKFLKSFNNTSATQDISEYIELKKISCGFNNDLCKQSMCTNNFEGINSHEINDHTGPNLHTFQDVALGVPHLQEIDKNNFTVLKIDLGNSKHTNLDLKVEDAVVSEFASRTNTTLQRKQWKHHQCDTCGKVFHTKPGLIHHIRIHTGERPYVCHLCDKRFINGGHLHTHMRTHTGEKNHICAACNKAFATTQQLTKHTIAIHTSERPYGCIYCPKKFASSSNLNTHTKIHTGEKNYHCDQCGKAFSTKGQLYQHMLVHTGEKAFLCEYCNKRFSQKAHLLRHLRTHCK